MECEYKDESDLYPCGVDMGLRKCVHDNALSCSTYKEQRRYRRVLVVLDVKGQRRLT